MAYLAWTLWMHPYVLTIPIPTIISMFVIIWAKTKCKCFFLYFSFAWCVFMHFYATKNNETCISWMFSRLLCSLVLLFWSYNPVDVVLKRRKKKCNLFKKKCGGEKWAYVKVVILNVARAILLKWDCCKMIFQNVKLDYKRKRGCSFGERGHFEMGSKIMATEEFSLWFRTCMSLYLLCIRCNNSNVGKKKEIPSYE